MHSENKIVSAESPRAQRKENAWEENAPLMEDSGLNLGMKEVPNIIYAADDKHSGVAYLMMDESSTNIGTPKLLHRMIRVFNVIVTQDL